MIHNDAYLHAKGEGRFVEDLEMPQNALFACPVVSSVAHGMIKSIHVDDALAVSGVVDCFSARDIPGENWIGNVDRDETLLAEKEVLYKGQPLAVVVAKTERIAREAAKKVKVDYELLPAIFDVREANRLGSHIAPPKTFSIGDVEQAWEQSDLIVKGSARSGAQEHIYLETQNAVSFPVENGGIKVFSATQSPGMAQRIIARVLGCKMHLIEVDVLRLGGGFGGKEEQATPWAVMSALAASRMQRPVKVSLRRNEDMRWTGKRHPYESDFILGLDKNGKILGYQVHFYQNAGAVADLSLAILDRTLFHAANGYFIPNLSATAVSCRTHLPPNTAFRGFGAPQAMFVLESAIFKAASQMGQDPSEIQRKNLLQNGHHFHYGMEVNRCLARKSWEDLKTKFELNKREQEIEYFNQTHDLEKKALAVMPICFGISFTAKFLNQAGSLVNIYNDGSVSVSCGAVEMGQGVREKIRSSVSRTFSISVHRVKVESTNTQRIANMSPTAASTGADLNGHATVIACRQILARLVKMAADLLGGVDPDLISLSDELVCLNNQPTGMDWCQLISKAYLSRCPLSAQAHYATPSLQFDENKKRGAPFAYHVYGCASIEVTVDCLRGRYTVDRVNVVHDAGISLDPAIDLGQIEGGVVQGVGWMTLEEILHDQEGNLLTDTLTTYKVPDVYFSPEVKVHFLQNSGNPPGLFHSKAVGEPPFMYGIAAYFAIAKAIQAFNKEWEVDFTAPMTPEKVLTGLYCSF